MTFVPITATQRAKMLAAVGKTEFKELLSPIPAELLLERELEVPPAHGEVELSQAARQLISENQPVPLNRTFAGGGIYPHHVPAVVDELSHRGEFYTAYTPYQPEVSQGLLQCVYEYQSYICLLTGMQVSNASGYDMATTLADAVLMAKLASRGKRSRVLFAPFVNPEAREVVETYNIGFELELSELAPDAQGALSMATLSEALDDNTAAVVFQYPDYLGYLDEGLEQLIAATQAAGALAIVVFYPFVAGLLKTPGELGADIVCGEAQCLGNPLGFGGPLLGYLACREKLTRLMPGRIIGRTSCERRDNPADEFSAGEGFVMTLQAREQHIRRARATSNICSNEALLALRSCIYMGAVGKQGFERIAATCHCTACVAEQVLTAIDGVERLNPERSYFNEFTLRFPPGKRDAVFDAALKRGILAGIKPDAAGEGLSDCLSLAFTEVHHADDIEALASAIREVL